MSIVIDVGVDIALVSEWFLLCLSDQSLFCERHRSDDLCPLV